ncbi:MAG: response regulator [Proteobacteria bacterium]|nr:response regulator [Pseudomonadota bacterium]
MPRTAEAYLQNFKQPTQLMVMQELKRKMYSLLILDYQMPNMSGKEVLAAIREVFTPAELPVLFLTGHGAKDVVIEVAKLGISGFFLKPLDLATVGMTVHNLLPKRFKMDEVRTLLSMCMVSDMTLSKSPGLEEFASRPNALFAVNQSGKKYIMATMEPTKTLRNHKSWSDQEVRKILVIYAQVQTKWFRIWPTFWDK